VTQVAFVEPYYESVTGAQQSMLPLLTDSEEFDARLVVPSEGALADEAREQGVPVEKLVFDDEGHGITKLENRIEAYRAIVEFLSTHLE